MQDTLHKAVTLIQKGEPIIVPTDTVYGLVCRYDSKSAVEKIYRIKKRTRKKPLILLGYNWNALKKFVKIPIRHSSFVILKSKWPGPLTLVLPASKKIPEYLNKGFKTIGIRVPDNKFLLGLLKHCPEKVLASTSANIAGESDRVPQKELLKKIKLFVKAKKGEMTFNPSKIIEVKKTRIRILR